MLIEALVIASCVQGSGCSQSTSAYYMHNKYLQEFAQRVHRVADPIIKENNWVVYLVVPVYTVSSGKTASIPLTKNTSLNVSINNSYVGFQFNY